MFKNYYGKTTANDSQIELVTVNNGSQLVLLSVQICGGDADGVLTLIKYDNVAEVSAFQQKLTVLANQPLVLQHKILLPTNYSFFISGTVAGISVCLNGVLQNIQSDSNTLQLTVNS